MKKGTGGESRYTAGAEKIKTGISGDIDREERRLAKGRPPNGSGMENANGGVDKINDEQKRDDS